jgi:hypothetical protein
MSSVGVRVTIVCLSLMVVGLLFAIPSEAEIDPDSIVGLWLFDEGKGYETEDSSGNGYHGDLEGDVSWVDGVFGTALEFKGGDYVELRDSAANLPFGQREPFTITAWVRNQGGGTVIGKFNGGVIGAYILVIGGGGSVTFHREIDPWGLAGSKPLPFGEFGHLAATYDGDTMKIYIDGELDVEQDRGPQNTDTVTPVLIGARFTGGNPSEFFNGALDEVALFNVALTEDQIQEVMKGLAPPEAVSAHDKLASTWGNIKVVVSSQ